MAVTFFFLGGGGTGNYFSFKAALSRARVKISKWPKLSENVPDIILVGQCDLFNYWLLMKISRNSALNIGCFDVFFQKLLILYRNGSDFKS